MKKQKYKEKIKQAVIDYIDLLKIGEDFIPHKCSVYIDRDVPELQDINFQYPTGPVVISDEEQCSPGRYSNNNGVKKGIFMPYKSFELLLSKFLYFLNKNWDSNFSKSERVFNSEFKKVYNNLYDVYLASKLRETCSYLEGTKFWL